MPRFSIRDLALLASAAHVSGPSDAPDSHANLYGWWRAFDLTLNDGDPVSTWTDRQGHITATQSGSTRPTFRTNIIGSKPVVRFASGQYMNFTITGVGSETAMMLLKPSADGYYWGRVGLTQWIRLTNYAVRIYDGGQGPWSSGFSGSFGDWILLTVRVSGTDVSYQQNKTSRGFFAGYNNGMVYDGLGTSSWAGDIAEACLWNRALSDAEVDGLYDNYFKFHYPSLP